MDDRIAAIQDPWASPLELVMSQYAARRQSYWVMRSAMKWRGLARVKAQLEVVDVLQLSGSRGADWHREIQDLQRLAVELRQILQLDRLTLLELSERLAVRGKSKRYTLRKLKAGWRDLFIAANEKSAINKRPGVLLRFLGLRPIELEHGVEIELVGEHLRVLIKGAKVRETAGQPWRRFSIQAARFPKWFVDELRSGKRTYSADSDSVRSHVARLSAKLYPRKFKEGKQDILLSPYVFRHALVSDLRSEGWRAEDIAAVLGESSAETAAWYGWWPTRGSRNSEPSGIVRGSIETCRPVRSPDRTWVKAGPPGRESSKPSKPPSRRS
jgi:hypothetical protein